ncbi:hypothetical protein SKAU_G00156920 [Synaphobranchus kaupii]|uniref:Uncharacterized protein n=1 Tax=Synaphobranchus kaupii TaxID=118154 RepID=A0A9Q1FHQ5_SYNKA|nr:hypothetical protein SKAU_G00156920 [Synaphobranchus kaupii]
METLKSLSAQMRPQEAAMGRHDYQLQDVMETFSEQVDQLEPPRKGQRLMFLWPAILEASTPDPTKDSVSGGTVTAPQLPSPPCLFRVPV